MPILKFPFSKGLGKCLNDKPTSDDNYEYPELPPGAIYDASFQCQLQFGSEGMEVCTPLPEVSFFPIFH